MNRPQRLVAAMLLAATACTSGATPPAAGPRQPAQDPNPPRVFPASGRISAVGIEPFKDCDALQERVRAEAARRAGPYGITGLVDSIGYDVFGGGIVVDRLSSAPSAPVPMAAPAQAAGGSASDGAAEGAGSFSGTNVQEEGVDEPDIVKTDGSRIFAIAGGRLQAVEIDGGVPRMRDSLKVPEGWGAQLLVSGNRALVIVPSPGPIGRGVPVEWQQRQRTTVLVVDVSNIRALSSLATLHLEGSYVSARMVDGIARLVVRSQPAVETLAYPADDSAAELRVATRRNHAIAGRLRAEDFTPHYLIVDRRGPRITQRSGSMVACDRVGRPREFSGFGTVSVVTVDPMHPEPKEGVAVLGDAETVYASAERLYVATTSHPQSSPVGGPVVDPGPRPADGAPDAPVSSAQVLRPADASSTAIHAFDISGSGQARYLASGRLPGHLLNQWSLSELDGNLRVATTTEQIDSRSKQQTTESAVTVLAIKGPEIVPVGSVGGLGKGERIYAVRFLGKVGYVVTFRQVDPLYVVDLSDPAKPAVTGELKTPGFSTYLHPVGEGLLLGIGKEADQDGRVTGMQASLFDVSDPAHPTQVARRDLGQGFSPVEDDHHAFLWWPETKLAVLPVQSWEPDTGNPQFSGAVGLRLGEASIAGAGRIEHEAANVNTPATIERSFVAAGRLFTLSQSGLMASNLRTLERVSWLWWPAP